MVRGEEGEGVLVFGEAWERGGFFFEVEGVGLGGRVRLGWAGLVGGSVIKAYDLGRTLPTPEAERLLQRRVESLDF